MIKNTKVWINGYPFKDYRGCSNGTYRQVKLLLIEKYKVCYWCGIKVIDYVRKEGAVDPYNTATIDHIKSRHEREKGEVTEKVLACYGCNQKRMREGDKKWHRENK